MATDELYHVRLTVRGEERDEVRLDLDRERLEQQFLRPYREGRTITVNGRSVASVEIQRIRVTGSAESAETFRPAVEQQLRGSSVVTLGGPSMAWRLAAKGRDVTDDLISGPAGYAIDQVNIQLGGSGQPLAVAAGAKGPGDRRSVFLVHGRDASAAAAMRDLLRAFGLQIIEWEHALQHLDQGPSPYVGDIVIAGMRLADAVVVLATPDDLVSLRQDLTDDGDEETTIQGQSRPNVIYEVGIADALDRARTLLVEVGRVKGLSDLGGRNTVRFNGSAESRRQLASRLRSAKLDVDDTGVSWLSAGDFSVSLNAARAALTAVSGINEDSRVTEAAKFIRLDALWEDVHPAFERVWLRAHESQLYVKLTNVNVWLGFGTMKQYQSGADFTPVHIYFTDPNLEGRPRLDAFVSWNSGTTARQLMERVGNELQRCGRFPGRELFQPNAAVEQLREQVTRIVEGQGVNSQSSPFSGSS